MNSDTGERQNLEDDNAFRIEDEANILSKEYEKNRKAIVAKNLKLQIQKLNNQEQEIKEKVIELEKKKMK